MTRPALDFETPTNGASCRSMRLVRQKGPDQQHPVLKQQAPRPASLGCICFIAPSVVSNLPKQRGVSPANGAIQTPQASDSSSQGGRCSSVCFAHVRKLPWPTCCPPTRHRPRSRPTTMGGRLPSPLPPHPDEEAEPTPRSAPARPAPVPGAAPVHCRPRQHERRVRVVPQAAQKLHRRPRKIAAPRPVRARGAVVARSPASSRPPPPRAQTPAQLEGVREYPAQFRSLRVHTDMDPTDPGRMLQPSRAPEPGWESRERSARPRGHRPIRAYWAH